MSNKLVKLSEEEKQQQENDAFLKGRCTRLEVMNYVNALLDEKILPEIYSRIQLSVMTLQAILIKKGVVTGDEIEEITQEFVSRHNKEQKELNKEDKDI